MTDDPRMPSKPERTGVRTWGLVALTAVLIFLVLLGSLVGLEYWLMP